MFLMFQCLAITSGPVTGHHLKEPGSTLFARSLQVFIHIDKIILFFRLHSSHSQPFLIGQMFHSLHHLCGSLLDSLRYILHVSLVLKSPELVTVLQL